MRCVISKMDSVDFNPEGSKIIDFGAYSLEKDSPDNIKQLVDKIHHALTTIGFFYLKNTGFPNHVIKDAFKKSKNFFTSEMDTKLSHHMGKILPGSIFGYVSMDQERLDTTKRHLELKECYNYLPHDVQEIEPYVLRKTPECSELVNVLQKFFEHGKTLSDRLLELIARGLHLEVRNRKGQWIPAPPIEGTILVLTGDLMQWWTSDRVIAAKHRVVFPASETELQKSRQSITFFGHPDGDEIIECIDGSEKYRPIGSREYLDFKLNEIWTKDRQ